MVEVAIIAGAGALLGIVFVIVRWGKLPPWSHRDVLAFVALCATIGGAMILTFLKWVQTDRFNAQTDRLITELVRERPSQIAPEVGRALNTIVDSLTWDNKLDSVGVVVVLLSLGLVISARTIKAKVLGSEFEMGNSGAAAAGARAVADSANETASEIESEAPPADLPPPAETVDAAPTARP